MRLRLQRFKFSIKLVPRCESTSPQGRERTKRLSIRKRDRKGASFNTILMKSLILAQDERWRRA